MANLRRIACAVKLSSTLLLVLSPKLINFITLLLYRISQLAQDTWEKQAQGSLWQINIWKLVNLLISPLSAFIPFTSSTRSSLITLSCPSHTSRLKIANRSSCLRVVSYCTRHVTYVSTYLSFHQSATALWYSLPSDPSPSLNSLVSDLSTALFLKKSISFIVLFLLSLYSPIDYQSRHCYLLQESFFISCLFRYHSPSFYSCIF